VTAATEDRRIRSLRPIRATVDPWRAHGATVEDERRPNETIERALTIFLAGAECPFTCSFCDLWRWTIDGPTPRGALPAQIRAVLQSSRGGGERSSSESPVKAVKRLKLYNASNFFDRRAVPPEDLPLIAELVAPFAAVTVESHASMVGALTTQFAQRIAGRLEVAIGLETIHPVAATRLNKRLALATFDRAATFLRSNDIDMRVFVLLGAPHVPCAESIKWTIRTVAYAAERGASLVSVIPVRGGNGELERLQSLGYFTPPTLSQLETVMDRCLTFAPSVVAADLWDVERLIDCSACAAQRIARLRRLNLTGQPEPAITCSSCRS